MGSTIIDILLKMKQNPKSIKFRELSKVCEHYFGSPRQSGTGDPKVNIQNSKGMAKTYQVKQGLAAIEKLGELNNA